jgi:hypothetical protein
MLRDLKDDDVTPEELVDMLDGVTEPTANSVGNQGPILRNFISAEKVFVQVLTL